MTAIDAGEIGHIRLEKDGAMGWIIIDQPARHNALTAAMWRSLPALVGEALEDSDIRVIVLRGAGGKAFSGPTSPNSTPPAKARPRVPTMR